jgi:hypothetical protein
MTHGNFPSIGWHRAVCSSSRSGDLLVKDSGTSRRACSGLWPRDALSVASARLCLETRTIVSAIQAAVWQPKMCRILGSAWEQGRCLPALVCESRRGACDGKGVKGRGARRSPSTVPNERARAMVRSPWRAPSVAAQNGYDELTWPDPRRQPTAFLCRDLS